MPKISSFPRSAIIGALGGNLQNGKCLCPAHDDHDPSLVVNERDGRVLIHCHVCGRSKQQAVIAAVLAKLSGIRPIRVPKAVQVHYPEEEQADRDRRSQAALEIYYVAKDGGKKPIEYFEGRGLTEHVIPRRMWLLSRGDSIRLHRVGQKLFHPGFPAAVAMIQNATGNGLAVHITWLTRHAQDKLSARTNKQMIGPMRGGFVVIGRPERDKNLFVAEGIETAASLSLMTGYPAVATLSAGNMPFVQFPECDELYVCPDNDSAGLRAARQLADSIKLEVAP